ncbi:sigma-70 family RNA polymerase sigma factor [bacterium]|nr:sigma-70 family RNA polymerase sigma factor [bacterium]
MKTLAKANNVAGNLATKIEVEFEPVNFNTATDEELVEMFRSGCQQSFEHLIKRYETKAYHLSMRLTRNQEDAEEVLQDVFLTVYRKLEGFEGKSKFSSWLYRITVNSAFMKLRKRKNHEFLGIEEAIDQIESKYMFEERDYGDDASELVAGAELGEILEAAIKRIPEEYRAVFVLRDVDGLSNQEVAAMLDITVPAVKSRLHRARMMLRKRLKRTYEEFTGNTAAPEERLARDRLSLDQAV